jgi:hypothetical protein
MTETVNDEWLEYLGELQVVQADTAFMLDKVRTFLGDYVVFPSVQAQIATALWVAHTYLLDHFETTARLVIKSPEKQTGKTRLLECLDLICKDAVVTGNISPAAMARLINDRQPTLLIDEIDTIFGEKAAAHEDTRAILNSGYRKGAKYIRCVGGGNNTVIELPSYCAVAVAGIGEPPETIGNRAVILNMRRKTQAETVQPFYGWLAYPRGDAIRTRLENWAVEVSGWIFAEHTDPDGSVYREMPQMPEGISDRQHDIWLPLIGIADLAGDEWGEMARNACTVLSVEQTAEDAEAGQVLRLLRDIRTVFDTDGRSRIFTAQLVSLLCKVPESEWAAVEYGQPVLNAHKLAHMLTPYRITSVRWRDADGGQQRGYSRASFEDAWSRYLPSREDMTDCDAL